MKQLLSESARYNAWANAHLVNLFRSVDDALISQTIVSSFPSIRKTLIHIWDVERLWLERLKGNSLRELPSKSFNGSNEDVFTGLLAASDALTDFIVSRPAPYYRDRMAYTTLSSPDEFKESVTDMAYQCLNHSTFHRGQLIVMCRQLDIKPIPQTDFILYRREAQLIEV
jgi:uncharacterized damage-inducible protein DinB